MGTTLTGTTPQDTYDSLIKVTDNGPLSGSLKVLTDGLGNNSALSLSTAAASIGGPLSVSYANARQTITSTTATNASYLTFGNTTNGYVGLDNSAGTDFNGGAYSLNLLNGGAYPLNLGTSNLVRLSITSAGNVGIGTSAPSQKLQVVGTVAAQIGIDGSDATGVRIYGSGTSKRVDFTAADGSVNERISGIGTGGVGIMTFSVNNNVGALTERVRIQTDGGISFNGDTAQANALDDYEEGTWTMGVSFGGLSVGVTTSSNTGTYTKVGRQVTVNGYIALTSKGSSTGNALLTGLPFTIANSATNLAAAALRFDSITFANQFQGFAVDNSTTIALSEITEAGVITNLTNSDFSNACSIIVGLTYFV